MPGEELCKICQKSHPTGFCVESEKNIFSKIDPLFERVYHLEEAPEIPEGLSKKEVAAISMPERITAEKLDFLINLKSCGFDISFDEISKLFLKIPDVYDLKDPGNVVTFIIEYIKFKMIQKDYVKVGELCDRFSKMFPKKVKVLINLYRFALEIKYPSNSIKIFAVLRGVDLDLVEKTEQKFKDDNISDQERQKRYAVDFSTKITGFRNNCGDEVADEMVEFAQEHLSNFVDIVPDVTKKSRKKHDAEPPEIQSLKNKISEFRRLSHIFLKNFGALGKKESNRLPFRARLDGLREELFSIIDNNSSNDFVVQNAQAVLFHIESTLARILLADLRRFTYGRYDRQAAHATVDAKRLMQSGDNRGAIDLLDSIIEEKTGIIKPLPERIIMRDAPDRSLSDDLERSARAQKEYADNDPIEIERKASERVDKLFERLEQINRLETKKVLTKKDSSAEKLPEIICAEEMDFLIGLASSGSKINLHDVEQIFIQAPDPDRLHKYDSVFRYILSYIKLKIVEGNIEKAIGLCRRLPKERLSRSRLYENLYYFCLENELPAAEEFKKIALDFGVSEEQLARVADHAVVAALEKDQRSRTIFEFKTKIQTVRRNSSIILADQMQKFAEMYVEDFANIPINKLIILEFKGSIRNQLRRSLGENFDLDYALKRIERIKINILAIIDKEKDESVIAEGKRALDMADESVLTLLIERLAKIGRLLKRKETLYVRRIIAEAVQVFDGGNKDLAIDLASRTLATAEKLLANRLNAQEIDNKFIKLEDLESDVTERLLEEFYSLLAKRDEVKARKILEELKKIVPIQLFSTLERKFLSMPTGHRPKRNAVWLNMADRVPVNKLAYRVSGRYKNDQSEDDE